MAQSRLFRHYGSGRFVTAEGAVELNAMLEANGTRDAVISAMANWTADAKTEANSTQSTSLDIQTHLEKVYLMGLRWRLTGDDTDLSAAKQLLLKGSEAVQPIGNPLDEKGLIEVAIGYWYVKDQFTQQERQQVASWLRSFYLKQKQWLLGADIGNESRERHYSNISGYSLAIQATIAAALDERELNLDVISDVAVHMSGHFRADNAVYDFDKRDALTYVVFDLTGLIHIGHALSYMTGEDFMTKDYRAYESSVVTGANPTTVYKAIDNGPTATILGVGNFLLDYVEGRKPAHKEFANTGSDYDKTRDDYQKEWEPGEWYKALASIQYAWAKYDPATAGDRYNGTINYIVGDWRDTITSKYGAPG